MTLTTPFFIDATIIKTRYIVDAMQYINEDSWVLLDIDNTFYEAKQAVGHTKWFTDQMDKRIGVGMTRKEAIDQIYPDWIKIQSFCSVQALEEDFVPLMLELQDLNVVMMGLTLRQPAIAKSTIRQVNSLGFDFLKTAPSLDNFEVPAATPTLYEGGILFTGDFNDKADIFLPFLEIVGKRPPHIVFIDDKLANVVEFEKKIAHLGIPYVGIYYTANLHVPNNYKREIADLQFKFLDQMMSNEAAELLAEYQLE